MSAKSTVWIHKKTQGLYIIIDMDANIEATMEKAVVYKSLADGQVWVRPTSEFFDGRFENLTQDAFKHD